MGEHHARGEKAAGRAVLKRRLGERLAAGAKLLYRLGQLVEVSAPGPVPRLLAEIRELSLQLDRPVGVVGGPMVSGHAEASLPAA